MMVLFYTIIIESILICSITIWCAAALPRTSADYHVLSTQLRKRFNATRHHGLYTSRTPGHLFYFFTSHYI